MWRTAMPKANQLATLWIDREFDPSQSAVYYVRVLQIPTVRHAQLDAIALGVETPYEGSAIIQERAYTSPVWYTPANLANKEPGIFKTIKQAYFAPIADGMQ
jgi:hypothetical protein